MIQRFRAYCKSMGKLGDVVIINYMTGSVTVEIDGTGYLLQPSDYDPMKSTGHFDDTGQEIFEKDVVKRTSLAPGGVDCVGVVKMLEGAWVIDTGNAALSLWTEIDENEVLGNVYEHPDLVEVAND